MLNAIDINQFLLNEQSRQSEQSIVELSNNLLTAIHDNGLLSSDLTMNQRNGLVCFGANNGSIGFLDISYKKKHFFQFMIHEKYLMMNQRRAQFKELKYFNHRLAQLLQIAKFDVVTTSQLPEKRIEFTGIPTALIKKLLGIFDIKNSVYWEQSSNQLVSQLTDYLTEILKKSKSLINKDILDRKKHKLFHGLKIIIESQKLDENECILITNSTVQTHKLYTVYSLFLYPDFVIFDTKNGHSKTTFKLMIPSQQIRLNNAPIQASMIPFLFERLDRVFCDVRSGRANILESTN